MAGRFEIGADTLRDIGMDGERVAPAAFAHDAQAVEATILMQIFNRESGDFRAPQAYLRTRMARSRRPSTVSSAGTLSSLAASALEKANVEPSRRLIAGRSTSATGLVLA